jgi:hypothetical protein
MLDDAFKKLPKGIDLMLFIQIRAGSTRWHAINIYCGKKEFDRACPVREIVWTML